MKLVTLFLLPAALSLFGCFSSGSGGGDGETSQRNIQYKTNMQGHDNAAFYMVGRPCFPNPVDTVEIKRTGDRLIINFGISSQNVKIENIYVNLEDKGFPNGVWKHVGNQVHEVLDSTEGTADEIDSLLEMDDFFFGKEVLYIEDGQIGFSYPHVYLYQVTRLAYQERKTGKSPVKYIGLDSVEIVDEGHQIFIKYQPYVRLTARSSLHEPPISVTLDSCDRWDEEIEDTWLAEYLNGTSVAAQGKRSSVVRSLRSSR